MKKIIITLLLGAIFYAPSFAQKITTDRVPVLIMRAFSSKFLAANQQSWSIESKGVYEVEFYNDKKRQSATFDTTGAWLATETEIKFNQLPHAVAAGFNKQFGDFTVQETLEVETPDKGTSYELTINKGATGYEVVFSDKGALIKKEAAKAED